MQQVEDLDENAPVALLRTIIERNKLPVSTGTGGVKRRTKSHILQDIQVAVDHAGWGQAVCLLAAALILLAVVQTRVPEGRRLYGPLITAGDAAVLSAQGVLRLCKAEKRRAALSHLTPTQRRKLGSDVAIWLASFASLALPSSPLVVLGRAPARVLASRVTVLRSAVFASRVPPAAATFATVAMGGAAKAGVGASTRAAAAAAAATAAAKVGVATLPASLLGSPAAAKTNHLVLELTRRSGAKFLLLDVRLPSAVNPVTRRVLASFPGLAY